jgi:hypothetical protein
MGIQEEFDGIMEGAGWATDEYIENHSPLSDPQKYALMVRLAKEGALYAEEDIPEEESTSDEVPSVPSMNVEDVVYRFKHLIGE